MKLESLKVILDDLNLALNTNNHKEVRQLLIKAVPEFNPEENIEDLLYNS